MHNTCSPEMIRSFSLSKPTSRHDTDTSLFKKLVAVHGVRFHALCLQYPIKYNMITYTLLSGSTATYWADIASICYNCDIVTFNLVMWIKSKSRLFNIYYELCKVKDKRRKLNNIVKVKQHSSSWYSISQLSGVTCHMESHSVSSHPTQVNTPHLNPSQTGR